MRCCMKTCNNCKALYFTGLPPGVGTCTLGFHQEVHKFKCGVIISYKPIEDCPKPLTNTSYSQLLVSS